MASSKIKAGDGYTYEFVATPPKALSCHLCHLVARDPHCQSVAERISVEDVWKGKKQVNRVAVGVPLVIIQVL